jgi:hypothetical protein
VALIGWVDTVADAELIVDLWPDAAQLGEASLARLLGASYDQCRQYAPALAVGAPVPDGWPIAQVYQADELFNASRREGDVIGFDDTTQIRVRPLGTTVKSLLRPRGAVPRLH